MIHVEHAHIRHARLIAPIMRPRDVIEIRQLHDVGPIEAMRQALDASAYARTMFYGFEPLAMYGLAPFTLLASTARLWIFATSAIDRHPLAFARACRKHLVDLMKQCDQATNLIALDDLPALKWADWLGCTCVLPHQLHGGRLFAQFLLRRESGAQCQSG